MKESLFLVIISTSTSTSPLPLWTFWDCKGLRRVMLLFSWQIRSKNMNPAKDLEGKHLKTRAILRAWDRTSHEKWPPWIETMCLYSLAMLPCLWAGNESRPSRHKGIRHKGIPSYFCAKNHLPAQPARLHRVAIGQWLWPGRGCFSEQSCFFPIYLFPTYLVLCMQRRVNMVCFLTWVLGEL